MTTATGSATTVVEVTDMMQPGHISLPNGYGLHSPDRRDHPDQPDQDVHDVHDVHDVVGVAPNELSSLDLRDWFAGTPCHKHVPARLEAQHENKERPR